MAEDRTPRYVGLAEPIEESYGGDSARPEPSTSTADKRSPKDASAVTEKLAALDEVRRDLQQPHVC